MHVICGQKEELRLHPYCENPQKAHSTNQLFYQDTYTTRTLAIIQMQRFLWHFYLLLWYVLTSFSMKIAIKQLENGKYLLRIKYDMFILDRNVLFSYTTIVLYLTAFTRLVLLPSLEFTLPSLFDTPSGYKLWALAYWSVIYYFYKNAQPLHPMFHWKEVSLYTKTLNCEQPFTCCFHFFGLCCSRITVHSSHHEEFCSPFLSCDLWHWRIGTEAEAKEKKQWWRNQVSDSNQRCLHNYHEWWWWGDET